MVKLSRRTSWSAAVALAAFAVPLLLLLGACIEGAGPTGAMGATDAKKKFGRK